VLYPDSSKIVRSPSHGQMFPLLGYPEVRGRHARREKSVDFPPRSCMSSWVSW
jgi:hypothetical protein